MGKETRGSVRDRALGSVGLFLIALIGLASGWGRTGRVVIWLVAAIGWLVDRVSFEHVLGSGSARSRPSAWAAGAGRLRDGPADQNHVVPAGVVRDEGDEHDQASAAGFRRRPGFAVPVVGRRRGSVDGDTRGSNGSERPCEV